MLQVVFGETAAVSVALEPGLAGDVTWTSRTLADAAAGTASTAKLNTATSRRRT